ncbi:ABC transporter substrate-binding protein [Pseudomonas sp. LRF_L74]|uniref:ABC transporter substrate-binding protein n=1 Tax=Pseudomonas sp. LRF_L74 TaxID=3369422 RepID=UPI003F609944
MTLHIGAPSKLTNRELLAAAGLDKDMPYEIVWHPFTSTPELTDAMRGGSIDLGGPGGTTGALLSMVQDNPIRVVAAAKLLGQGGSAIVVPDDSAIHRVADLRGKRIAIVKGSRELYALYLDLTRNGLELKDVELKYVGLDVALPALLNGSVDAWVLWDPQTAYLQNKYHFRVIDWIANIEPSYGLQLATDKALADPGKHAAIEDFLQRVYKARLFVNAHPQTYAAQVASRARIDEASALLATERGAAEYVQLDERVRKALQHELGTWQVLGVIGKSVRVEDYLNHQFDQGLPAR